MGYRHFLIPILISQVALGSTRAYAYTPLTMITPKGLYDISARLSRGGEDLSMKFAQFRSRLSSEKLQSQSKEALLKIQKTPQVMAGSLAHNGQTLLVIWMLSMVTAFEQSHKIAHLSGRTMTQDDVKQQFSHVTNQVFNGFEIFAGIVGGGTFGVLLGTPLRYLTKTIQSQVARPFLANLLASGAASFVTFVGWELGRQLWKEAILLLPTPEEVRTANSLQFLKVMSGQGTDSENQLFAKIIQNAWVILTFGDPELGQAWVYNTWRLCVASGEFVTLVLSMTTASVIASTVAGTVAPGAGHVVGFVTTFFGGLAGGLLAHKIPAQVKEPISKGLWGARQNLRQGQMQVNAHEINRILSSYSTTGNGPMLPAYQLTELEKNLNSRSARRNNFMTIQFEKIYFHFSRHLQKTQELALAEQTQGKNSTVYKEAEKERAEPLAFHSSELSRLSDEAIDFYAQETLLLQRLLGHKDRNYPTEVENLVGAHLANTVFQLQFLLSLLAGLNPQAIKKENLVVMAPNPSDFEKFLNGLYFFGYREAFLQELLKEAGSNG